MLTALASVINLSAVSLERSKLIDPHNDEINVANSQLWNAHFICDTRKPRTLWLPEDIFSTGRYIVIVHPMKSRSLCTLTNCRSEKYSWDSKLRALWFLWVVKIFFVLPHFAPKLTFLASTLYYNWKLDIFSLDRNHLSIECRSFEDKEYCCQRFSHRRWVPDDHIWSKLYIFNRSTLQDHCIQLVLRDLCLSLQCIVLRNKCLMETIVPKFALGNFPEARRIRFNLPKTAQNHFSSSKIYWFITNYLWFCTNKILKERQWPHIFSFFSGKPSAWCGSSLLFWPCLGSGQM